MSYMDYISPKLRKGAPGSGPGDVEKPVVTSPQIIEALAGNVDEVIEFMEDNPELAESVKAAERARTDRKPRTTILEHEVRA